MYVRTVPIVKIKQVALDARVLVKQAAVADMTLGIKGRWAFLLPIIMAADPQRILVALRQFKQLPFRRPFALSTRSVSSIKKEDGYPKHDFKEYKTPIFETSMYL